MIFDRFRMSGTDKNDRQTTSLLPHQERVNIEMFKAIEILGKKLERVEDERDRLARRLALIESAATLDEKTGKFYLPVVVDRDDAPYAQAAPRWMVASSVMSTAIAVFSLFLVLFHETAPALTPRQLAALNAITTAPRFAHFEDQSWKKAVEESDALASAQPQQPLPDTAQLAADEQAALNKPPEAPAETAVAKNEVEPAAGIPAPPPPAEVAVAAPVVAPAPVVEPAPKVAEAPPAEKQPAPEPKIAEEKPAEKQPEKEAKVAAAEPPAPEPAKPAEVVAAAQPPVNITASGTAPVIAPDTALPEKLAQLEKNAFAGVPEAQHDLATLYASGKLVAQDYKRAAYWFSRAADGGVANADYNLGVLFQQGLGVRQDVNKALGWYQKAAELGHPEAMYNLGIAYIEGIGTARNTEKGVAYFKSAANAGVAQAAYNLGVLYESNFIGPIDLDKALDWYQVAANAGHAEAEAAVTRLKTQLAKNDDQALTVADLVEPAAGEVGEGDSSPASESMKPIPPPSFTGEMVVKIQDALVGLGLLPPPPTGKLDAPTQDAIRAWQARNGMNPDGRPSQEVLDKMTAAKK